MLTKRSVLVQKLTEMVWKVESFRTKCVSSYPRPARPLQHLLLGWRCSTLGSTQSRMSPSILEYTKENTLVQNMWRLLIYPEVGLSIQRRAYLIG